MSSIIAMPNTDVQGTWEALIFLRSIFLGGSGNALPLNHVDALLAAIREFKHRHPFEILAWVFERRVERRATSDADHT